MSGIDIQWECKVKRDIDTDGVHWAADSLVLKHHDEKGLSLFDPTEQRELWEHRVKRYHLGKVNIAGDWIITQNAFDAQLVRRSTGEVIPGNNLRANDFFRFASDTHAVFSLNRGGVILDLATGESTRRQNPQEDLTPLRGCGSFFMAEDRTCNYYTGQLEAGTGRLLKEGARLLEGYKPSGWTSLASCSAAFASARREGELLISIYSWSGDLLINLEEKDHSLPGDTGCAGKFLLAPDGTLDSLLVIAGLKSQNRIFLFDLKDQGKLRWTVDVPGWVPRSYAIIGKRLFWLAMPEAGAEIRCMSIDLEDGTAAPLIDEPIAPWLETDGRGLFFGKMGKGRKHIAYGLPVS